MRKAWFTYKPDACKDIMSAFSVCDFVAGYNAALHDMKQNDKLSLADAAQFVSLLRVGGSVTCDNDEHDAHNLFSHFVEHFDPRDDKLCEFAEMCGFPIAVNCYIHSEE